MEHMFSVEEEKPARLERVSVSSITHEVAGEHILPDYMPPIRRMVSLRAAVLPEGKFLSPGASGATLELAGTVAYSLIYTDDEGKPASVSLTAEYSASTLLPSDVEEAAGVTVAESNSCRVLAPRKVSLRSRLRTEVEATRSVSLEERVEGDRLTAADAICLERLPVELRTVRCLSGESKGLRTEGILATVSEPLRPVLCDGRVTVKYARAVKDGVAVRGDIAVSCLCVGEEPAVTARPTRLERVEEFEEKIELPGCGEGDPVTALGRSVSLTLNNDEAADGSREISYELLFDLETTALQNRTVTATADLYSTERETDCTYCTGDSLWGERALMSSLTVSESLPYKGAEGAECIDVTARAEAESKEWRDGKLTILGSVVFGVLTWTPGGELAGEEYRVPFRYSCDSAAEGGCVRVHCSCAGESARIDGGKITVGAEVFFAASVFGRDTVTTVDTVRRGEAYPAGDKACIRACFPIEGETLWQVAKRYHVSGRRLAEENGLDLRLTDPVRRGLRLIV